jgi:hypothetical protein
MTDEELFDSFFHEALVRVRGENRNLTPITSTHIANKKAIIKYINTKLAEYRKENSYVTAEEPRSKKGKQ